MLHETFALVRGAVLSGLFAIGGGYLVGHLMVFVGGLSGTRSKGVLAYVEFVLEIVIPFVFGLILCFALGFGVATFKGARAFIASLRSSTEMPEGTRIFAVSSTYGRIAVLILALTSSICAFSMVYSIAEHATISGFSWVVFGCAMLMTTWAASAVDDEAKEFEKKEEPPPSV